MSTAQSTEVDRTYSTEGRNGLSESAPEVQEGPASLRSRISSLSKTLGRKVEGQKSLRDLRHTFQRKPPATPSDSQVELVPVSGGQKAGGEGARDTKGAD